jgi:hypothetical protein
MDLENGALNPKNNPSPMSLKPLTKKTPDAPDWEQLFKTAYRFNRCASPNSKDQSTAISAPTNFVKGMMLRARILQRDCVLLSPSCGRGSMCSTGCRVSA